MTIKHMLDGLMQATKSRHNGELAAKLDLEPCTLSKISRGEQISMRMDKVNKIHRRSGVPLDTLFTWYRMPATAVLGRIA